MATKGYVGQTNVLFFQTAQVGKVKVGLHLCSCPKINYLYVVLEIFDVLERDNSIKMWHHD